MTKQIQLVVFVAYDDTQIIIRIIQVKNTTVTAIDKKMLLNNAEKMQC